MRSVKNECRVLGIDDMAFDKFNEKRAKVVGVLFRGGQFMDGCLSTEVDVDGSNATEKISSMLMNSKFKKQVRCIMLDGIAVGGFNIIDVQELYQKTNTPVIVIIRTYPDIEKIHLALKKLGMKEKIELLGRAGGVKRLNIKNSGIYFQNTGIDESRAKELIKKTCTRSLIPEPIRVAHLIGQGIMLGESRGSA